MSRERLLCAPAVHFSRWLLRAILMKQLQFLSFLMVSVCWAGVVFATPPNTSEVPNGDANNCQTCHVKSTGGQPLNDFGRDFSLEIRWTESLCEEDSDGDGYTNGEELGDPLCGWRQGPAARSSDITNPGDAASTPQVLCGNLIVQEGEECDGFNLDGKRCVDVGDFTGGALDCQSCQLSTAGCTNTPEPFCGDGRVDPGEACDGDDLAGLGCADAGEFERGTLRCTDGCALDTSECVASAPDMMPDMRTGMEPEVGEMGPDVPVAHDMNEALDMGAAPGMEPGVMPAPEGTAEGAQDGGCEQGSRGSRPAPWFAMVLGMMLLLVKTIARHPSLRPKRA